MTNGFALKFGLLVVVVITVASSWGASPRLLAADVMESTRGASGSARKCEESCLRLNNMHDDCDEGAGEPCESCTNATTSIYFLDMFPFCEAGIPGWKQGAGIDCGNKKILGTCTGVGVCGGTVTSMTQFCNDGHDLNKQPN